MTRGIVARGTSCIVPHPSLGLGGDGDDDNDDDYVGTILLVPSRAMGGYSSQM